MNNKLIPTSELKNVTKMFLWIKYVLYNLYKRSVNVHYYSLSNSLIAFLYFSFSFSSLSISS